MRGPWSHAKPEIYVKREDLLAIARVAQLASERGSVMDRLADRLVQVLHMGGTLTIIEDTAKARSGDAPYR